MINEIRGMQFAVQFKKRGTKDSHICLQLRMEDDDNWFNVGNSFSGFWLADLIEVLTQAQETLQTQALKDPTGFGYQLGELEDFE